MPTRLINSREGHVECDLEEEELLCAGGFYIIRFLPFAFRRADRMGAGSSLPNWLLCCGCFGSLIPSLGASNLFCIFERASVSDFSVYFMCGCLLFWAVHGTEGRGSQIVYVCYGYQSISRHLFL